MSIGSNFIERITGMRRARGMPLAVLAEKTQIPYTTLQQYLSGKRRMPATALSSIAVALDVSADWVLFGKPPRLDKGQLAKALEVHDNLREVSGDKLSRLDYAKIFEKSYEDWAQPDIHAVVRNELSRRGIEYLVSSKSVSDKD